LSFIEVLTQLLFKFIGLVMKFAPFGAFGAMAFTIGKYGIGTFLVLGQFMLSFYTTSYLYFRCAISLRT
jgi:aerobic C4-dicarboxylate transport protein